MATILLTLSACNGCDDETLGAFTKVIEVNDDIVDFGSVFVGAFETRTLRVRSRGTGAVTLRAATVTSDRYTIDDAPIGLPLGPGAVAEVVVRFVPLATSRVDAQLILSHDGDDRADLVVDLRAVGSPRADCDDGDQCTTNIFDPFTGQCRPPEPRLGATCSDNNACTTDDSCAVDGCRGLPISCPAPAVACAFAACSNDDGCLQIPNDQLCVDDDPCTIDRCDLQAGCVNEVAPDGTLCGTFASCGTVDLCIAGFCSTVPIPEGTPCDDGDLCTLGDVCAAGVCGGEVTEHTPGVVATLPGWARPTLDESGRSPIRAYPAGDGLLVAWDRRGDDGQLTLVQADLAPSPGTDPERHLRRGLALQATVDVPGVPEIRALNVRDDVIAAAAVTGEVHLFTINRGLRTLVTRGVIPTANTGGAFDVVVGLEHVFACGGNGTVDRWAIAGIGDTTTPVFDDGGALGEPLRIGGCLELDLDDDGTTLMVRGSDASALFDVSDVPVVIPFDEVSFESAHPSFPFQRLGSANTLTALEADGAVAVVSFTNGSEVARTPLACTADLSRTLVDDFDVVGGDGWAVGRQDGFLTVDAFPGTSTCLGRSSAVHFTSSTAPLRVRADATLLTLSGRGRVRGVDAVNTATVELLQGAGQGLLGPLRLFPGPAIRPVVTGLERFHTVNVQGGGRLDDDGNIDATLSWGETSENVLAADVALFVDSGLVFPLGSSAENPRSVVLTRSNDVFEAPGCSCVDLSQLGEPCPCTKKFFVMNDVGGSTGQGTVRLAGALASDGGRFVNVRPAYARDPGGAHEFLVTRADNPDLRDLLLRIEDLGRTAPFARGVSLHNPLEVQSVDLRGDTIAVVYDDFLEFLHIGEAPINGDDFQSDLAPITLSTSAFLSASPKSVTLRDDGRALIVFADRVAVYDDTDILNDVTAVPSASFALPGVVGVALQAGAITVLSTSSSLVFLVDDNTTAEGFRSLGVVDIPGAPINAVVVGDALLVSTAEALYLVTPACPLF